MMMTNMRQVRADARRFHDKAALWMTLASLVLLVVLSVIFGDHEQAENNLRDESILQGRVLDDGTDYTRFSCRYIYEQVPDSGYNQCQFARDCNGGEGVWAPFVFCHYDKFKTVHLFLAISPIMIVWMVTLFRLLGSTAEAFFSPSLEMFSVKLGLPPRFAGVTLLALGNGAADVSATISAIVSDVDNGYKLSLGALTGAAMLVGGVVAGIVVLVADGVPCRGALVRDVTALLITVGAVWMTLSAGTIGAGSITLFLSMYGVFVSIVLVADIYHRTVVLPRIRALQAQQDGIIADGQLQGDTAEPGPPSALSRVMTAISNYDNVCPGDGAADTTNPRTPGTEQDATVLQEADLPIQLHGHYGLLSPENPHDSSTGNTDNNTTEVGTYALVQDHTDRFCLAESSVGFGATNWHGALHDGKQEVMASFRETWEDVAYNGDLNALEKAMLICEFPFTILRKATVPIPCEGYYNRGIIALSMALCPLWFGYYIWIGHDVNLLSKSLFVIFFFLWSLFIVSALAIMRYAPGGEGTMAMSVATPIAFVGFVIAATWIDYIADHLVSLLDFIGIILHIPGSIMGLTILAWGNSMGDLSANMTMARKGLSNMAMTACFAGPVFNILVGLGLGFSSLATKTGIPVASVSVSSSIITGFIFVILNCLMLIVTGVFVGKGRIETSFGYIALGLYITYVVVSICLELFV